MNREKPVDVEEYNRQVEDRRAILYAMFVELLLDGDAALVTRGAIADTDVSVNTWLDRTGEPHTIIAIREPAARTPGAGLEETAQAMLRWIDGVRSGEGYAGLLVCGEDDETAYTEVATRNEILAYAREVEAEADEASA